VFAVWCWVHAVESFVSAHGRPFVLGLAGALVTAGQALVLATFYRLGRVGVIQGLRKTMAPM